MAKTVEERFWAKVNVGLDDDCWNWNASLSSAGYGQLHVDGKPIISSRVAWFVSTGDWPVDWVCHTCDNRRCCNPRHLFQCTNKTNTADKVSKGRQAHGEMNGKISNSTCLQAIEMVQKGVPIKSVANHLGIHRSHVWRIVTGRSRKGVENGR